MDARITYNAEPELPHAGPRRRAAAIGCIGTLLLLAVTGCRKPAPQAQPAKAIDVVVTLPVSEEVVDYQDFPGRLEALKTVDLRARVTGPVKEVPFKEGDVVHRDDLLFLIDPDTYKADLNQAEANYRLAEAERRLQEKNLVRAQRLVASGSMSREEYDATVAALEKANANVGSIKAALDRARLYYGYCRVTAPFDGKISRRFVDPGNNIKADDTVLTRLVTEGKLYVYFDVDERTYLGLPKSFLALHFPIAMRLANEDRFAHVGLVDFIDNSVSATTGTVRMRGVFDDPTGLLKPGLFARVRVPTATPYKALLVPGEAIASDQGRHFVYGLSPENKVVYHPVTLGQSVEGLRVVKEGVGPEERVLIAGTQRVRPGSEVKPQFRETARPAPSPLLELFLPGHAGHDVVRPAGAG